jgi:hypothetical protein
MSNSYAISAVTATLWKLFHTKGITVTTKPPDAQNAGGNARLNIFLYQLAENSGYKNMDQPARSYSGDLFKNQQVGLDLYYLLTAYGKDDDDLSAQKTLAESVEVLHESPVLTRDLVIEAINDVDIKAQMPDIGNADLAEQVELVKVVMHTLSLEDLAKIWTSFFKTSSYRISVCCKATVVLLDGKENARITMPVRERNIYTVVPKKPEIRYVQPQIVEWLPSGMELNIYGNSLKAEEIKIDLGQGLELENMPSPTFSTDEKLVVNLPGSLAAGVKQIKVIHPLLLGTPKTLHKGPESNAALFAVVPKILDLQPTSIPVGAKLTVKFEPKITKEQEMRVIIGTYRPLSVEWTTTAAATETDIVEVEIPLDIRKDEHPVRLRVDGAESQPDKNIDNEYKRKTVTIT